MYWLAGIPILALVCWQVVRRFESRQVYKPQREHIESPEDLGLDYEEVWFMTEDARKLQGWWFPAEDPIGTVLFCHGNAGNISTRLWMVEDFQSINCNLFMYDYRGFGKSKGSPSEVGLQKDARAAYEVVRAKYEDAEDPPIVILGISLGGAVAIQLALDKPCRGLVVQSSLSSSVAMSEHLFPGLPLKKILRDQYDSESKIADVTAPILIAHSTDDALIPYTMGQTLFGKAKTATELVTLTGEHKETGWRRCPEYWVKLTAFIRERLLAE
jgi:fermentation-respiration switch protein FrsA (DUF1100 family)